VRLAASTIVSAETVDAPERKIKIASVAPRIIETRTERFYFLVCLFAVELDRRLGFASQSRWQCGVTALR
jgi:hypothetical protein